MARGWESKSVEEQQAEFAKHSDGERAQISDEERQKQIERQGLELARANVTNQLKSAQNSRYIELLKQELTDLERKIEMLA